MDLGCRPARREGPGVQAALAAAAKDGSGISVTAIARRTGVDRTFLYRHRDLLGQVHAQAAEPLAIPGGRGPAVSRVSLQTDLVAADARTARLAAQVRALEARLGEVLGEQIWRETGIGGPDDTEQLKARITTLEQQVVDLELKLQDQGDELNTARTTIRHVRPPAAGSPMTTQWTSSTARSAATGPAALHGRPCASSVDHLNHDAEG
jgi:transposase-like protein